MARQQSPTELENGKAAEAPIASSDAAERPTSPMDRFKSLARRLVNVPRDEHVETEKQFRKAKAEKS